MQKTYDAFANLLHLDPEQITQTYHQRPEFVAYEKGELSDSEFRSALRDIFCTSATDEELDFCWNAMLVDIPLKRIELLEQLRGRYRLYLLSNTNGIHAEYFNQIVNRNTRYSELDALFDQAFYSHCIKMRKPDLEIYEYVLSQNNLIAEETLFIDDNLINLEAAERLGIRTYHVQHPDIILTLF
ncbi:MAG: HAD family phosphatase [Methylococcaceae bacterium]|nr:HAD family phosphatase [Methylococcaceae bacterium]